MIESMYGVMVVPLIIGLVALFVGAGLPKKWGGLLALGVGLLIGVAYGLTEAGWTILQSLIIGAALGLSASGLYSTQKNVRETPTRPPLEVNSYRVAGKTKSRVTR
ncbi:MAG: hypothetical protein MJA84_14080 [Firmicutes bacterium]|nr:hypothetical protein [Bacillota bacterium]